LTQCIVLITPFKLVLTRNLKLTSLQVTPMELTEKLLEAAVSKEVNGAPAVKVLIDTVEGIERSPSSSDAFSGGFRITGVRTKQHGVIAADRIVICLGPWSGTESPAGLTSSPAPSCAPPD
jgi:glycine/D-amino acid oxidase-like deaminating enzyme